MRPLSAIVELSATTGSISRDVSPAPSIKDDREEARPPNESLDGAVNLKGNITSTPIPTRTETGANPPGRLFPNGMRSSTAGNNAISPQVPARNSLIIHRNPIFPRSLPLPIPIPEPYSSPPAGAVTTSPWETLEGSNPQSSSNPVTTPPSDEEHPSDVDLPGKSSSLTPANLESQTNRGLTLLGTASVQPEVCNTFDGTSLRSGSSGGGGGNIPVAWRVRSRKNSPANLQNTIPYRPQYSTFETGGPLHPGYQSSLGGLPGGSNSRVQSPAGLSVSIYEPSINGLPLGNPPPAYSRHNSTGSHTRGSFAAPSPWQRTNSLGYRPVAFSIPNTSQKSHLQEYPIDKKGARCRKLFTGLLFIVYITLCFFFVVFVIGGPELGFFTRGFQNSLIATCTVLHPSPTGYVIYMLMHVWNLIWIIWALGVTCQSSQQRTGGCFRAIPPVMTCTFLCELIFGLMAQGLWLFTWDLNITYGAMWLLVLQFASFLLSLSVLSSNIVQYCYLLETIFYREYCFIKVCCQNGIAGLLALSVVELLLSLNTSMTNGDFYYLQPDVSASMVLTLIAITLLVYLILDVFIFEQATRFVISPYLCVTWVTCAVLLSRKPEMSERNMIILGGIVFLSAMLAGVKVIISIICHRKYASRLPGIPSPYAIQMAPRHMTSENL